MFTGAIAYKHCKGRPFLANFCMILHWNSFIHPSKVYFSVNQQDRTWWWNECLKVDITGWKNLGENIFWLSKRILINRRGKVRRRLEERVFLWIYEGFLLLSQSVLSLGDESLKLISHMFFSYPLSFFFFFTFIVLVYLFGWQPNIITGDVLIDISLVFPFLNYLSKTTFFPWIWILKSQRNFKWEREIEWFSGKIIKLISRV